ncbi:unnamed protein product, partial [Amoebophrya sp. A120]
ARGVLSEVAGNISVDALSSGKFYHFIRCGSTAVTLEIALQVEPTIVIVNEEVKNGKQSLTEIVKSIAEQILKRRDEFGLNSGVILLSDGLVENGLVQTEILKSEIAHLRKAFKVRTEAELLLGGSSSSSTATIISGSSTNLLADRTTSSASQLSSDAAGSSAGAAGPPAQNKNPGLSPASRE